MNKKTKAKAGNAPKLKVGTLVRSTQIGTVPAFDGKIVAIERHEYIVEDPAGKEWLRDRSEIKPR